MQIRIALTHLTTDVIKINNRSVHAAWSKNQIYMRLFSINHQREIELTL